uniref:Uncharacterized protein n=1 Tax=Erwinia amylovora ATCC BAA-2158 TaxID=889211 RepID=E5B1R4_ERWAM|nr:hypothetical protein EAIL5_0595 [Erwinia amylovora ATCC BAA-2158]
MSVGAVYEIIPTGTEGRPASRLDEIRDVVENALQDSLPELDSHQWVVQFYCQDESDLSCYMDKVRGYVRPWAQEPLVPRPGSANRRVTCKTWPSNRRCLWMTR